MMRSFGPQDACHRLAMPVSIEEGTKESTKEGTKESTKDWAMEITVESIKEAGEESFGEDVKHAQSDT